MKFVALALALLLAVGSQAASLQANAPSQLQHIRAAVDMYLERVKEGVKRSLDQLDGTPYSQHKGAINEGLDNLYNQMKSAQQNVAPVTDSVVSTLTDATADVRNTIKTDFEALQSQLEPMMSKLREVLERHYEDYRNHMEPLMKEYAEKQNAQMEALRPQIEDVMTKLQAKVDTNLEETKAALTPIVDTLKAKLTERIEYLKKIVTPYVEEYKEQVKQAYSKAQGLTGEQYQDLRVQLMPLAEDVKLKLAAMAEIIRTTYMQN